MEESKQRCIPKHTPGEATPVIDPESGVMFKRVVCAMCGRWLSDELLQRKKG